jgi:hypothetical protein
MLCHVINLELFDTESEGNMFLRNFCKSKIFNPKNLIFNVRVLQCRVETGRNFWYRFKTYSSFYIMWPVN